MNLPLTKQKAFPSEFVPIWLTLPIIILSSAFAKAVAGLKENSYTKSVERQAVKRAKIAQIKTGDFLTDFKNRKISDKAKEKTVKYQIYSIEMKLINKRATKKVVPKTAKGRGISGSFFRLAGRPSKFSSAHKVKVQMVHGLAGVGTAVCNDTKT
jgi:hypothetical protein